MTELRQRNGTSLDTVGSENPLWVRRRPEEVQTVGGLSLRPADSVEVPGIATGAAYADKDQIGGLLVFPNVTRASINTGVLQSAYYYDLDDEGLQVDLWLFTRPVTLAADNAAFALSDADLKFWFTTLQFTTFYDAANGQVSKVTNIGEPLTTVGGTSLWGAAQARGALNIAAGHLPRFGLGVFQD